MINIIFPPWLYFSLTTINHCSTDPRHHSSLISVRGTAALRGIFNFSAWSDHRRIKVTGMDVNHTHSLDYSYTMKFEEVFKWHSRQSEDIYNTFRTLNPHKLKDGWRQTGLESVHWRQFLTCYSFLECLIGWKIESPMASGNRWQFGASPSPRSASSAPWGPGRSSWPDSPRRASTTLSATRRKDSLCDSIQLQIAIFQLPGGWSRYCSVDLAVCPK